MMNGEDELSSQQDEDEIISKQIDKRYHVWVMVDLHLAMCDSKKEAKAIIEKFKSNPQIPANEIRYSIEE
jgi:hypothetical protein